MFRFDIRLCLVAVCLAFGTRSSRAAEPATIHLRGNLDNCRVQFEQKKTGRVAFMGGSITEMNGYRPMVCEILKRRFGQTDFTFIDAGLSSTCSTTGVFRLTQCAEQGTDRPVLRRVRRERRPGCPSHAAGMRPQGVEEIVRQALRSNPNMDIVFVHFVNPEMLQTLQAGKTPLTAGTHEEVAEHYGISTLICSAEVAAGSRPGS